MSAPRGRKRQRSETVATVKSLGNKRTNMELDASSAPESAFTVFEDPVKAPEPGRPAKRKRKNSLKIVPQNAQTLPPSSPEPSQDVEMDLTSNRTISSAVPSIKELTARNVSNAAQEPVTPPNRASQLAHAMMMSSAPSIKNSRQDRALVPRNSQLLSQATDSVPFPSLLKSPFRPSKKISKEPTPSENALFRRPSEGSVLRPPLASRENHRRPSDAYAQTRRQIRPSFLRKAAKFSPHISQTRRKSSMLDELQKSVPRTPLSTIFPRSPSIMSSGQAAKFPPIPRIPAHVDDDTPMNDTDQLIADMSDFSLAPNPKDLHLSPIGSPFIRTIDPVDETFQTQSSPGVTIPSLQISWCKDSGINSSPIKPSSASSSDPLDLLHPKYYFGNEDTMKPNRLSQSRAGPSRNLELDAILSSHDTKQLKPPTRVYGRKTNKSVQFAIATSESEADIDTGTRKAKLSKKAKSHRPFPRSPPRANPMEVSDDEILLH